MDKKVEYTKKKYMHIFKISSEWSSKMFALDNKEFEALKKWFREGKE